MRLFAKSLEFNHGGPLEFRTSARWIRLLSIVAQIALLLLLSKLGNLLAGWLGLSLPGNVVGMLFLFLLLSTNLVRLKWIDAGASLLLKHLAFFFVPIAVGLMALGDVWRSSGLVLLFILAASAAAGIVLAGFVTQLLAPKKAVSGTVEHSK